jgi:predicted RNA-binding Zn-ribbon protein involved in translation (DUF1610 family)
MVEQLRILAMKCPSCGAMLDISNEMTRFACGYCGTEQVVERSGGTVSLKPVIEAIASVQTGTDKTAAELALKRLEGELAETKKKSENVREKGSDTTAWVMTLYTIAGIFIFVGLQGIGSGNLLGTLIFVLIGTAIGYGAIKLSESGEGVKTELRKLEAEKAAIEKKIAANRAIADS